MPSKHPRPSRRQVLAGALALAGARAGGAAAPERPRFTAPIDVDVHCHTFCSLDLPIVGFVAHYIPGLTEISRELFRWPEALVRAVVKTVARLPNAVAPAGDQELAALQRAAAAGGVIAPVPPLPPGAAAALVGELDGLLRGLPFSLGADTRELLARYLEALYLVAHPRAAIAASLAETYPSVALFTPCLVDYDAWSEDRTPTPLATQILIQKAIAQLSARGRIQRVGARFHPFVAFDPRRDAEAPAAAAPASAGAARPPDGIGPSSGALAMVRYAIESSGFAGVKLYPAVGFAPLDNPRLRPREPLGARIDLALRALYGYCQAEEVPITTHTSAANEFGLGFRELVGPERWAPVLRAYPDLRLNFGHFGHDYGTDRDHGARASAAWIRQAARLMQAHHNVYADLSSSPMAYDPAYAARFLDYLADVAAEFPRIKKRLMYGSDWWLNRLEPGSAGFLEAVRSALCSRFTAAEVADVMGRNALRFLGLLDDDDRLRPGRSARRLRAFYQAAQAQPPPWLA